MLLHRLIELSLEILNSLLQGVTVDSDLLQGLLLLCVSNCEGVMLIDSFARLLDLLYEFISSLHSAS